MERDTKILFELEENRTSPVIADWRTDVEELFATSVRILYACFVRDKFRPDSGDGLCHLRTMLLMLPDATFVDNLHQHCRDLGRRGRRTKISKVERARACVDSGVLEQREITHEKITEDEFIERVSTVRRERVGGKFQPTKHMMGQRFSHIIKL